MLNRMLYYDNMSNKKSPYPLPLVVISLLLVSFLSIKVAVSFFGGDGIILGTETWIAKGGDDDNSGNGSSNSGSSNDDDDDSSGSGGSGSGGGDDGGSGSSGSGSGGENFNSVDGGGSLSLPASTYGECEGPDGQKFNTNFNACNDLNKAWGISSFEFEKIEVRQVFTSVNENDDDELEIEDEVETEIEDDSGVRIRTVDKEDDQRTEIKISETERIRTRVKDGVTRIDITSGGVKTRLQYEEGRVVIKAEREGLDDVELEDDTIFKIDDRLAKSAIKVSTASAETFLVQRGTAAVQTDFPISIDLETNVMSVNTPAGLKTLTILPDQVIANLLISRTVNRFDSSQLSEQFQTGELAAVTDLLTLEDQNEGLVYEIKGISDQRLLGFIPVSIEKDIAILVETGVVISEEVSIIDRIIDTFSF